MVLLAVLLAILGALLHPVSLVLGLVPLDARGFEAFLQELRATIANLLGWGLLSLLAIMVVFVVRGRLIQRTHKSATLRSLSDNTDSGVRAPTARGVVVAITAYNDAEATARAVRDFRRQPGVIQVLVIDNNSTDQTAERATDAGARVVRETRQGYGYACMRGLAEGLKVTGAEVIVLTEGDGTFVAEDTAKFLAYMDDADLVVGNRVVRGLVDGDSQMDYFFTWGNMAVAMLLRLRFWDSRFLGPAGLTDVGCTFRAIRRPVLERLLPYLVVGGNHFSPHMILVALARGFSVIEIPIRFRRRLGKSKGASRSMRTGITVGLAMIWHIMTFSPSSTAPRPGVFVERDGVIVRQRRNGQIRSDIELLPGAAEGLAALSRHGRRVIVVGDELAPARAGLSRLPAVAIHARIASEVNRRGGHIEAFIVCPHNNPGCSCRYPQAELMLKAQHDLRVSLADAVVVSNRPQYLEAAARLGCGTIFIRDGSSEEHAGSGRTMDAEDLTGAVAAVLAKRDISTTTPTGPPPQPAELHSVH